MREAGRVRQGLGVCTFEVQKGRKRCSVAGTAGTGKVVQAGGW